MYEWPLCSPWLAVLGLSFGAQPEFAHGSESSFYLFKIQRLYDVGIDAALVTLNDSFFVGVAAHDDQRNIFEWHVLCPGTLFDQGQKLHSAHSGHIKIQNDQSWKLMILIVVDDVQFPIHN
jgi:hypothetical protein